MSSIINAGTSGVTITGSTSTVLSLATNGTTRLNIDASGNLAVGTGNLTFSSTAQRITGDFSGTNAARLYFQSSTTNGATSLSAMPNGTGTQTGWFLYAESDLTNNSFAAIRALSGTDMRLQSGISGTGTYLPMTFYTGGSERMRLDTSGNLGIGTTNINPVGFGGTVFNVSSSAAGGGVLQLQNARADAAGNTNTIAFVATDNTSGIRTAQIDVETEGATANNRGGKMTIYIKANGGSLTSRMVIDQAGNVGIGTASPGTKLDAYNSSTTSTIIRARNDTTTVYLDANNGYSYLNTFSNHPMLFGTNNTERMRIDSSGNTLFGKTVTDVDTVGSRIDGAGRIFASINTQETLYVRNTTAAAYRFYVDSAGTVFATNTTISAISDQRYKENIRDLDTGLDAILALKPRTFDWKEGKGKNIKGDRGFIAQEFEQVFPNLVDNWKDPAPEGEEPYKSVRQDLIPVLVKAIQELSAKVAALEAK